MTKFSNFLLALGASAASVLASPQPMSYVAPPSFDNSGSNARTECSHFEFDLSVVVDGSGSIQQADYAQALQFSYDIISNMNTDKGVKVSLYQFSHDVKNYLQDSSDSDAILAAMNEMYFGQFRSRTMTARALSQVHMDKAHYQVNTQQVVVLITDGNSEDDVTAIANQLHKDGFLVYAIGVGNGVNRNTLESIASRPHDEFINHVDNYDELVDYISEISEEICIQVTPQSCRCENGTPATDFHCQREECARCDRGYQLVGSLCRKKSTKIPKNADCNARTFDLYVLLDGSSSIQAHDFELGKNFVDGYTSLLNFGPQGSELTVAQYAYDYQSPPNYLNWATDNEQISRTIRDIKKIRGGGTQTAAAMRRMFEDIKLSKEVCEDENNCKTKQVMVVITDGASYDGRDIPAISREIHDFGVTVWAIGVGPWVDQGELNAIASQPSYVFTADGYDKLDEQVTDSLAKLICVAPKPKRQVECSCVNGFGKFMTEGTCPGTDACIWCYEGFNLDGNYCVPECRARTFDLHFVFDTSSYITEDMFNSAIDFAKLGGRKLRLADDGSRVSVWSFNGKSGANWALHETDKWDLNDDLESLRAEYHATNEDQQADPDLKSTLAALEETLSEDSTRLSKTKSIVIIFTGGYSRTRFVNEARNFQSLPQLTVAAIGYGPDQNNRFLQQIASPSTRQFATSFSIQTDAHYQLLMQQMEKTLMVKTC